MVLVPAAVPRRPGVKRKAFISGVTGQDGSYLAELLLDKGYEVHGLIRRARNSRRVLLRTWGCHC